MTARRSFKRLCSPAMGMRMDFLPLLTQLLLPTAMWAYVPLFSPFFRQKLRSLSHFFQVGKWQSYNLYSDLHKFSLLYIAI